MENNETISRIEEDTREEYGAVELFKSYSPEEIKHKLESFDLPIQFNTINKLTKKNILLQFELNLIKVLTNTSLGSIIKEVKFLLNQPTLQATKYCVIDFTSNVQALYQTMKNI
jgi:hypothetical protein